MKNRSIIIAVIVIAIAAAAVLYIASSTPASYKDGSYSGEAVGGAFGDTKVTVTISGGKIIACRMENVDKLGNPKDENYGRGGTDADYQLAQYALQGMAKYPQMLRETQNVDKMDAVSGATVTFREFQAAVHQALAEASK